MEVLLTKNVDKLGGMGSIVTVKDGFARNFLLPRGMAVVANKQNRSGLERQIKILNVKKEAEKVEAQKIADKVSEVAVTVHKQVGEENKIFGSVTTAEVVELLKAEGIEATKKQINIVEEIKKVGVFDAEFKVHPEVKATFKIWVVAQ